MRISVSQVYTLTLYAKVVGCSLMAVDHGREPRRSPPGHCRNTDKLAWYARGMINTTQHVVAVCQPGKGAATCRYLTMDDDG